MNILYFCVPSENAIATTTALNLAEQFSPDNGKLNVEHHKDYVSLFLSTDSIAVAAKFKLLLAEFLEE